MEIRPANRLAASIIGADALRLVNIAKRYGDVVAVRDVNLVGRQGEFITLLGPSGCGKTTTLNMVAGFLQPSEGSILLAGQPVDHLPPFRRDLGVVFQDYALFPHMTVAANVAYGLRMRRTPKAEMAARVQDALTLVKLGHLGDRRPNQLSGGQRQRVALARALVIRPKLLLLDEPLSNLDLKLREAMRGEILSLQRQLGITTLFVTHDQAEAMAMSDWIAVMQHGSVQQYGRPADIYERPANRFVAEFIGTSNILPATLLEQPDGSGRGRVRVQGCDMVMQVPADALPGTTLEMMVRPERLTIARSSAPDGGGEPELWVGGIVSSVTYLGDRLDLQVAVAPKLQMMLSLHNNGQWSPPEPGEAITLTARGADCWILPQATIEAA